MPGTLSSTASLEPRRGVLVYDVNAPWREKVFEALGSLRPVVGIAPRVGWHGWHPKSRDSGYGRQTGYRRLEVQALPGWARRLYPLHRPYFWLRGLKAFNSCGIGAVVITIPHHWPLLKQVGHGIKRIYYCPDYYQAYQGWDSEWVRKIEIDILTEADAVITVSEALRQHFISLIPGVALRTWVVPNGTAPEFLADQPATRPLDFPLPGVKFQRPLLGCVGVFNSRIDYRLLYSMIDKEKEVWLALVGPLEAISDKVLDKERNLLLAHPRVITAGHQPHESLPAWLRAMDVLLIPFRESKFNYMCSPMRLFDYLSSGRPIVGTITCKQVAEHGDLVYLAKDDISFNTSVKQALNTCPQKCFDRWDYSKTTLWQHRAFVLGQILDNLNNL